MLQLGRKSRIFAILTPRQKCVAMAVIRFEKTASRLTAIFLPRCNTTYLLSGANIQTKNETRAKRCQILSIFNTFGTMTKNERFKKALDWLYSEGLIVDQQELSSKTGINEATISRILNNKVRQPSPETIRKLVSVFRDIDPAYLRRSCAIVSANILARYSRLAVG